MTLRGILTSSWPWQRKASKRDERTSMTVSHLKASNGRTTDSRMASSVRAFPGPRKTTNFVCRATRESLPQPRPNGWTSDVTQPKASDNQPNPAQAAVVTQICTVLESALYGQDSGQLLVSALQQELRFAETVDVWAVWPFPATPDSSRLPVLSWSQDLSEVLRIGLHTERLPTVLPLMTLLFEALPACSSKSEHLITTLDVLTELRHDMRVTEPCRKCIDNMLSMESLVGDVVANPPPTVGSNMRAYLKDHSLNRTDAFWQSALQPLVPSDPNEADTPAHTPNRVQKAPIIQSWPLSAEDLRRVVEQDDLSPSASDVHMLVENRPQYIVPEALRPTELQVKHRSIMQKLGYGPHGRHAIRAYVKRHTNTFHGDFNQRMIAARKAIFEEAAPDLPLTSLALEYEVDADMSPTQHDFEHKHQSVNEHGSYHQDTGIDKNDGEDEDMSVDKDNNAHDKISAVQDGKGSRVDKDDPGRFL